MNVIFIKGKTAHEEEYVCVNVEQIACMTYYERSNMTRIDTVIKGMPIWFDGNQIERLEYVSDLWNVDSSKTYFVEVK